MIRSVRHILSALVNEQLLNDEHLLTFICECERIINSRPLTYISSDSGDPEVITPNSLLLLQASHSLPPGVFQKDATYPIRRWKQVQYLANIFWKRWTKEYLPRLQSSQKWQRRHNNLKSGDVVLLNNETARGKWPVAVVETPITSHDGLVRACKLRVSGGSTLTRPVTQMYMLESS